MVVLALFDSNFMKHLTMQTRSYINTYREIYYQHMYTKTLKPDEAVRTQSCRHAPGNLTYEVTKFGRYRSSRKE